MPAIRRPRALKQGATIGIAAPAGPIDAERLACFSGESTDGENGDGRMGRQQHDGADRRKDPALGAARAVNAPLGETDDSLDDTRRLDACDQAHEQDREYRYADAALHAVKDQPGRDEIVGVNRHQLREPQQAGGQADRDRGPDTRHEADDQVAPRQQQSESERRREQHRQAPRVAL